MIGIQQNYNSFFRQLIFLLVLIFIGGIIVTKLRFFLGSFLGAITLYIVLRNSLFYLTEKKKWSCGLAASILTLAMLLFLVILSFLILKLVASEIPEIRLGDILTSVKSTINNLKAKTGINIVPENILTSAQGYITGFLTSALNATYSFAANSLLMLLVLFFMLFRGRKMEFRIFQYIPFKGDSLCLIKHEIKGVIYGNAIGIPVIMVGQFIMSVLIFWILGINEFLLWGLLTAIGGLIPVVGTALIWLPFGIFLMVTGNIWQGVVLILYGAIIIGNTDNVLRIILMKKAADTHPLVVIFGVLLGIPLFGFWGIIFGPLLISGFLLLTKIYFREYELIKPRQKTLINKRNRC